MAEKYDIGSIGTLKIDTEGHDCVILANYIAYCDKRPDLLARKVIFESNMLTSKDDQDRITAMFVDRGYQLVSRGLDTVLTLDSI